MTIQSINWQTESHNFEKEFSTEILQGWDAASYFLMSELIQAPVSQQLWTGLSITLKQHIINETISRQLESSDIVK